MARSGTRRRRGWFLAVVTVAVLGVLGVTHRWADARADQLAVRATEDLATEVAAFEDPRDLLAGVATGAAVPDAAVAVRDDRAIVSRTVNVLWHFRCASLVVTADGIDRRPVTDGAC